MSDDDNELLRAAGIQIGHAYQEKPQRKFQRAIPDELQVTRDVPKTPKQATGYLSIRQAKDGAYAINVVGNVLSTNYRTASLNELLTFVGDWASGQYNEVKE